MEEEVREMIRVAKSLLSVGVTRVSCGEVYGYVQLGKAEAILDILWKSMEEEESP